jgi:hypothetical protein
MLILFSNGLLVASLWVWITEHLMNMSWQLMAVLASMGLLDMFWSLTVLPLTRKWLKDSMEASMRGQSLKENLELASLKGTKEEESKDNTYERGKNYDIFYVPDQAEQRSPESHHFRIDWFCDSSAMISGKRIRGYVPKLSQYIMVATLFDWIVEELRVLPFSNSLVGRRLMYVSLCFNLWVFWNLLIEYVFLFPKLNIPLIFHTGPATWLNWCLYSSSIGKYTRSG